jgi:hypothetical protein
MNELVPLIVEDRYHPAAPTRMTRYSSTIAVRD